MEIARWDEEASWHSIPDVIPQTDLVEELSTNKQFEEDKGEVRGKMHAEVGYDVWVI